MTPPARATSGAVPGPDITPAEAHDAVAAGRAVLLDVREPEEWQAGHAAQARHLPLGRLADGPERVGCGPEDTILVVCRSGNRSAVAAQQLAGAGLTARNVAGGMAAWERAGLPVVRDGGAPGTVA